MQNKLYTRRLSLSIDDLTLQGSGSKFNVVQSPEPSQLLAFTTTYTNGSKTVNLYLDVDSATEDIILIEYTGKLKDSAYMFSVYKVTYPALPPKDIIPTPK